MAKIKLLDGGKIKMTVKQIMDYTKLGRAAVMHRLKHSSDSKLVLAPKGKHGIGGYKKNDTIKKISNYYTPEKVEMKKKAQQIQQNHPFYDDGEKGKLHRLLFGKWFKGEK